MKRRRFSTFSEINVTNLVDVTLVLLIIFMITAPLLQRGIDIRLPRADAENIQSRDNLTITLSTGGRLYINRDEVASDQFETALIRAYESAGRPAALLRADSEIPYGRVITLMDRIRKAGISNIGLIVEPGEKQ